MLRDCVPEELPEPERLVWEGHQALDNKVKRLMNSAGDNSTQVKALFDTHLTAEPLSTLLTAISRTMKRVKWGMHPFGQKLVSNL